MLLVPIRSWLSGACLRYRLHVLAQQGTLKIMGNLGALGDYIREQRRSAEISLRQLAEAADVSNPYLSQIERGLRKPSADILQQIAKGLQISAEALYVQAGMLSDEDPGAEVPAAIRADTAITERQKQVLLDIYNSFRRENRRTAEGQPAPAGQAAAGEAGDVWEATTDRPSAATDSEPAGAPSQPHG